jgi:hypothetical protein
MGWFDRADLATLFCGVHGHATPAAGVAVLGAAGDCHRPAGASPAF